MMKHLWTVAPSLFLSMVTLGACAAEDPGAAAPDAADLPDAAVASMPIVSTPTIALAESSETTFTVALSGPPAASPATVVLDASDPGRLRVEPWALTFSAADWDQPQVVTLAALGDDDAADDALRVTVAGEAVAALTEIQVAVADDDTQAIAVLSTPPFRLEERSSTTIEVRLTARPAAPVLVEGGSDDSRIAYFAPSALTFTPDDWAIPQRLTVIAVEDSNATDDRTKLRLKALGFAQAAFEVEVLERSIVAIAPSTLDLGSLLEGNDAWFDVVLTARPTTDVLVEVVSTDPDAASVDPATLSFSPTRWDVPQRVTVSALRDADALDQNLTIALGAPGLDPRKVAVQVVDDDVDALP